MIFSVLILAAIGILNPSYRGGFMSVALFLFVFAGLTASQSFNLIDRIFSGYLSARLFKQFGGTYWKLNALRVRNLLFVILSVDRRLCPWSGTIIGSTSQLLPYCIAIIFCTPLRYYSRLIINVALATISSCLSRSMVRSENTYI